MDPIALVNIGEHPNDGTGDKARVAFAKINENFDRVRAGVQTLESGQTDLQAQINALTVGISGATEPAGAAVSAYRVVKNVGWAVLHASAAASDDFGQVDGISLNAAEPGESVHYTFGLTISNLAFGFVAGQAVYLGADGALTQDFPTSADGAVFRQQVGTALSETQMRVRIDTPIRLASDA